MSAETTLLDATTSRSQPQESTATSTPSATSSLPTINVGTRRSLLARIQADLTVRALKKAHPDRQYEIHDLETKGDLDQKTALHEMGAKALWTEELEELLLQRKLDCIVHCLKDMPTQLPKSCSIGAITEREDPRDALVVHPKLVEKYTTLASLPAGSLIGTSSVRRTAQLSRCHPHLKFDSVRGNVGTRLSKLDKEDGPFAAIILAVAGLERLGLGSRITARLSSQEGGMLHAVGQGALAIEIRSDDEDIKKILDGVHCERTTRACLAERSLMRTLEGGCSVPIGVETEWVKLAGASAASTSTAGVGTKPARDYDPPSGKAVEANNDEERPDFEQEELIMRAIVVSIDGQEVVESQKRGRVLSREAADEFGWQVAQDLVSKGAEKILEKINLNRNIIESQDGA